MTHIALYREWRPQRFADMIGQEHVTRTLRNALDLNRINHAYLFCGPRGTGKTSAARILAKAVNCSRQQGGEPCDDCPTCRAISGGQAMDVLEIDAASNRGIDEIRELREKVRFAPVQGSYRVYIIDEVHMLTSEAFNALLKTLEEPPAHVIFILATTEAHKVPATILSRCQRFDFRRISASAVARQLLTVADKLKLEVSEEALGKIVKAAEGSLRDALGLLDQCAALAGDVVQRADVDLVLGTVAEEYLDEMAEALIQGNVAGVLNLVDGIINEGKEVRKLAHDLIDYLRDLLVVGLGDTEGILVGRERERLIGQSQRFGADRLIKVIRCLTSVESDMRWALQPRWLLETALIQIAENKTGEGEDASRLEALARKVEELEGLVGRLGQKTSRGRPAVEAPKRAPAGANPAEKKNGLVETGNTANRESGIRLNAAKGDTGEVPAGEPDKAVGETDLSVIKERWPGLLEAVRKRQVMIHALVREAEPVSWERGVLTLAFKKDCRWHRERMEEEQKKSLVEEVLGQSLGAAVSIRCVMQDEMAPVSAEPLSDKEEKAPEANPLVQGAIEIFGKDVVKISGDVG